MNFIWIMGHLGADPEARFTANGQKVTTLRIATNQRRQGQEDTVWYRVTIWGDRFDKQISYLKKGSPVIVGGELRKPEIYTDRNGQPQISLEVWAETLHFSPFGRANREEGSHQQQGGFAAAPHQQQSNFTAPQQQPQANSYNFGGSPFAMQQEENDPFALHYEKSGGAEHDEDDPPF